MEPVPHKPSWDDIKQNKEIKIRYIVIAVIIAVVIRFWGESSITMLQEDIPVVTDTEISREEINRFIKTEQECINENIIIDENLLADNAFEDKLDPDVHEWFLVRGWRPKRFLYVKQRIHSILEHIYTRQKKLAEAEHYEKLAHQAELATSLQEADFESEYTVVADLRKKAHNIRYYINREIRHAGITQSEDDAVSENIATIETLLERY